MGPNSHERKGGDSVCPTMGAQKKRKRGGASFVRFFFSGLFALFGESLRQAPDDLLPLIARCRTGQLHKNMGFETHLFCSSSLAPWPNSLSSFLFYGGYACFDSKEKGGGSDPPLTRLSAPFPIFLPTKHISPPPSPPFSFPSYSFFSIPNR